ncbi:MAG TPA: PDZ domain-containing protein [Gemmatimonadales bacterium]|nr:PDZ domain-containing protein [Gemmatimonadales bacterium]HYT84451.1 PDZ domain-containing protein [Gemmatimonadales bacterium]
MQRKWIMIAAAVLAAWPAALAAQQTPRPPRPPRAWAYALGDHRGRIGVVLRTEADAEIDKIGAKIEGVTPGGPAAKAGLKVGDVITKFNGTPLGGVKSEDEEDSGPGTKLVELAHKLEPGDTVQIEYRRGTETKQATLVAEELGGFSFSMPGIPMTPMPEFRMPSMGGFTVCAGDMWCDLDMVTLNPDLGEYFGTKEGVLVVKAPSDSGLPLRGGDVILSIGGRKPTGPSHAMRILRSYEVGETVSIDVMRKQKRTTVTWTVPKPEQRRMRRPRASDREDQSDFRYRTRTRLQRV